MSENQETPKPPRMSRRRQLVAAASAALALAGIGGTAAVVNGGGHSKETTKIEAVDTKKPVTSTTLSETSTTHVKAATTTRPEVKPTLPPTITTEAPTTTIPETTTSLPEATTSTTSPNILLDNPFNNIDIKANDALQNNITIASLNLIDSESTEASKLINKYSAIIEFQHSPTRVYALDHPARIILNIENIKTGGPLLNGIDIGHEFCHINLEREYEKTHPKQIVPANVWAAGDAEKTCEEFSVTLAEEFNASSDVIQYYKDQVNKEHGDASLNLITGS